MSDKDTIFGFNHVFDREVTVINNRRGSPRPPRDPIVLKPEGRDSTDTPVLTPNEDANIVGLALSGGGIRSAAFCLGALQALDETKVLKQVDYLSTVSGGGYIGCSLSAGLQSTGGTFPFESRTVEDETPSTQHIRNYSNYLFPGGAKDVLGNASIYARGLIANFFLLAPFLLAAAALTIVSYLGKPNILGLPLKDIFGLKYFVTTAYLSLLLLVVTIGWGLFRSNFGRLGHPEVPSRFTTFVGVFVLAVLFSAFCELQPFVLAGMLDAKEHPISATLSQSINAIAAALAPIAAVIAFLGRKLAELVKSAAESTKVRAQIAGFAAKGAIYLAAIVVPLLCWVIYLYLSYWGICINRNLSGCTAPGWLNDLAHRLDWISQQPAAILYIIVALILFILSLFLRPNSNSLHPLYRDRLRRAFLFKPEPTLKNGEELEPLQLRLSELTGQCGPYHLINTALNIQNSKKANRRGRNADFFLFSQNFVGSETTGYVATKDIEKIAKGLNLATAMAVSGAAASSNMGAATIKPLTPSLAILNVRLGYWLRNPLRVAKAKEGSRNIFANFYFLVELLGLLNESRKSVYLTDGGHIENLGLYELFKRQCRVIIAVDAEADREMAFGSFNTLVRFARIDFGMEIDLPWQQITNKSRETSEAIDAKADAPKSKGPHCAIGQITYPNGRKGVLVYIKSSLTGDENDYVFHYKRRYAAFPHETTVDQMFSEEQFEAYRALGYHAAYGLFDRRDDFAKLDINEFPKVREQLALLDRLFPRVTESDIPGQRQRFVDWLTAPAIPDDNASDKKSP